MPKGLNQKAEAAKERKESAKAEASAKASKAAEDSYWRSAGEGEKSKAQSKKEDAEKKKQEAAAKKLEAKKLAEAEEEALSKPKAAKAPKAGSSKVTQHQLDRQREIDAKLKEQQLKEKELSAKRVVTEDRYSQLVEQENVNRQDDVIDVRSVDDAIAALAMEGDLPVDKHPEKRVRAAWLAFQERELPVLRKEKPNLKMTQYRDMLWKAWQKSPENPLNAIVRSP